MPEDNSGSTEAAPQKDGGKASVWAVIRKYTTVEILIMLYALPSYLNYVAVSNLPLEKVCTSLSFTVTSQMEFLCL